MKAEHAQAHRALTTRRSLEHTDQLLATIKEDLAHCPWWRPIERSRLKVELYHTQQRHAELLARREKP